ncbi:MAG: DUF4369 domain-containing protein [Leeuwenhoekiella sp.]
MIRSLYLCLVCILLMSCSKNADFTLSGRVNGLKKGTLYLQKVEDSTLVYVDSMVVDGDPEFELKATIKEPQIVILTLDKVDADNFHDRLIIFAEPREMTVNTSLKEFISQAAITGSENHLILKEYQQMVKQFNNRNLELIKRSFEVRQEGNEDSILAYDIKLKQLTRSKYLYTINFAMNHRDLEVAPYLAVSEIFDARRSFLDTIYNSLTPKVKKSLYGKELKSLLKLAEEEPSDTLTATR